MSTFRRLFQYGMTVTVAAAFVPTLVVLHQRFAPSETDAPSPWSRTGILDFVKPADDWIAEFAALRSAPESADGKPEAAPVAPVVVVVRAAPTTVAAAPPTADPIVTGSVAAAEIALPERFASKATRPFLPPVPEPADAVRVIADLPEGSTPIPPSSAPTALEQAERVAAELDPPPAPVVTAALEAAGVRPAPTAIAAAAGGLAPAPWLRIRASAVEALASAKPSGPVARANPHATSLARAGGSGGPPMLGYAPAGQALPKAPFDAVIGEGKAAALPSAGPKLPPNLHDWAYAKLPAGATDPGEQRCLAEAIYFEARSEAVRGQVAIAQVVLNRVRNPAYPGTICGVVHQRADVLGHCQFAFACDGRPDQALKAEGRDPIAWRRAVALAAEVTEGRRWLPEIADATHYHPISVSPEWKTGMARKATVGTHHFYRTYGGGLI